MFSIIKKSLSILSISGVIFASTTAMAAQGHLNVDSKAEKIIAVVNENGERTYKRVPAAKVLPGEVVQYSTFFTNISGKPADNINITNPIPKHTVYLANTASGANCNIVYSIDGGKQWAKPAQLKVRGSDGKMYPAPPSDYTHIRWQYQGDLQPQERKAVSFQVRLL
ncbi:MAG: Unknown protein [uncultured Thiotrichaceae bacterium]|uniref:DUF11 domain-containing protein n=1 Tax=uncultured Thiotrichaceae bacterium TaxID=298394 RepID=A0A6S6TEH0_9GAMM|nr:MAG: Unknown protein [uncultured Thiotrichaceae bacterium]